MVKSERELKSICDKFLLEYNNIYIRYKDNIILYKNEEKKHHINFSEELFNYFKLNGLEEKIKTRLFNIAWSEAYIYGYLCIATELETIISVLNFEELNEEELLKIEERYYNK